MELANEAGKPFVIFRLNFVKLIANLNLKYYHHNENKITIATPIESSFQNIHDEKKFYKNYFANAANAFGCHCCKGAKYS